MECIISFLKIVLVPGIRLNQCIPYMSGFYISPLLYSAMHEDHIHRAP